APALPDEVLYPKEQALVKLVRRERARSRRGLIFITHTERRDLSPRLRAILEREGVHVAVLKASTVAADRREEWVPSPAREGTDGVLAVAGRRARERAAETRSLRARFMQAGEHELESEGCVVEGDGEVPRCAMLSVAPFCSKEKAIALWQRVFGGEAEAEAPT